MAEAHIVAHSACCLTPQSLRLLNHALVCQEGVAFDNAYGTSSLEVTPGAAGMNVIVEAGSAFIEGGNFAGEGMYFVSNDAQVTLPIDPADPADPRCDLVIAQVDGTATDCADAWVLTTVTGVPAPDPACPAVPSGALVLATVQVPAGATSIVAGNITDQREAYSSCTPVTDWSSDGIDFTSAWANGASPGADNRLEYKVIGDVIYWRGLARRLEGASGNQTLLMFTIPTDLAPTRVEILAQLSNLLQSTGNATEGTPHTHSVARSGQTGPAVRVEFDPNGEVTVTLAVAQEFDANQWVSLGGVSYPLT